MGQAGAPRLLDSAAMSGCCEIGDLDDIFGPARAEADARRYLRSGLSKSGRAISAAVRARGVAGRSVLEVGGGIGAIGIELLRAGAASATNVELSRGYEDAARALLERTGLADRVDRRLGDFVTEAPRLAAADDVILDRVVCCYPDPDALVGAAAEHARELLVVVIPAERWWMRVARAFINLWPRLRGWRFRFFVHPTRVVIAAAEARGMRLRERHGRFVWQMLVFAR